MKYGERTTCQKQEGICLEVRGHWELSEPEEKGDGDVLLGKDSCHASSLCGNAFMPEQVSLGKQVNLFKRCFCDHTLSLVRK